MTECPVPYLYLTNTSTISYLINTIRSYEYYGYNNNINPWCSSTLANYQRTFSSEQIQAYPFSSFSDYNNFWIIYYALYACAFYILAIRYLFLILDNNNTNNNTIWNNIIIRNYIIQILLCGIGLCLIILIPVWNSNISTVMINYKNMTLLANWSFGFTIFSFSLTMIPSYKNNMKINGVLMLLWIWIHQQQQQIDVSSTYWVYSQTASNYMILYLCIIWLTDIYINFNSFIQKIAYGINFILLFLIGTLPLINLATNQSNLMYKYTELTNDQNPWCYQILTGLIIICIITGFLFCLTLYLQCKDIIFITSKSNNKDGKNNNNNKRKNSDDSSSELLNIIEKERITFKENVITLPNQRNNNNNNNINDIYIKS